jgi:hypothetical protein
MTTIHQTRPFNLRYIVREAISIHGDNVRTTHRTAQCNFLYIMRQNGIDEFGPTPDFAARSGDLVDHGRLAPIRAIRSQPVGVELWKAADDQSRASRPELATAMHAVGSLPLDGNPISWRNHVVALCEDQFVRGGMIVDWAIHALADDKGGFAVSPHAHFLLTSRTFDRRRAAGRWQPAWYTRSEHVRDLKAAWYKETGLHPIG